MGRPTPFLRKPSYKQKAESAKTPQTGERLNHPRCLHLHDLRCRVVRGQWYEFGFSWHCRETSASPLRFGGVYALHARRNEIPPDIPRTVHGRTTHDHQMRADNRLQAELVTWPQHQQCVGSEAVTGYVDFAGDHVKSSL